MRKLFTIMLAMVMLFAITAFIVGCGNDELVVETPTPTPEIVVEATPTPTPEIADNIDPETGYEICLETGYLIYPNARYAIFDGNIFTPIYIRVTPVEIAGIFFIDSLGDNISVESYGVSLHMERPEPIATPTPTPEPETPELLLEPIIIDFDVDEEVFLSYFGKFVDEIERITTQYELSWEQSSELAAIGTEWLLPLLIEMEIPVVVFNENNPGLNAIFWSRAFDRHFRRLELPDDITEEELQLIEDRIIKQMWLETYVMRTVIETVDDGDVMTVLEMVFLNLLREMLSVE